MRPSTFVNNLIDEKLIEDGEALTLSVLKKAKEKVDLKQTALSSDTRKMLSSIVSFASSLPEGVDKCEAYGVKVIIDRQKNEAVQN